MSAISDREFIQILAKLYEEKRSDVSEICNTFLTKGIVNDLDVENRYISAKIPETDIEVEYDTLTTELSYHKPLEQWQPCINHKYSND